MPQNQKRHPIVGHKRRINPPHPRLLARPQLITPRAIHFTSGQAWMESFESLGREEKGEVTHNQVVIPPRPWCDPFSRSQYRRRTLALAFATFAAGIGLGDLVERQQNASRMNPRITFQRIDLPSRLMDDKIETEVAG